MAQHEKEETVQDMAVYKKKVWITCGIVALLFILLWLLKILFPVLLYILAATLISLFFIGLSNMVCRVVKMPRWASLLTAFLIFLAFATALFWFIGYRISEQIVELSDTLPSAVEVARQKLEQTDLGSRVVKLLTSEEAFNKAKSVSGSVASGLMGAAANLYVILFVAIFFTVTPALYKNGFVKLLPQKAQPDATAILNRTATELSKWIKGKLFAMLVVFILTAVGLWIVGAPMPLALALLAGIVNFIPNFGPLIAMVPAVLVCLPQGNNLALIVAGLYVLIQVIESNFITPLVQQKLVKIPPALIITAQVVIGLLTGILGLLLATPIVVILMMVLQKVYLKEDASKDEK